MRIGIDARFFGGEQSKGLGRYTQKLVEHLLQLDNEHTFVLFVQQETHDQWKRAYPNVELVVAPYKWYTFSEQLHLPGLIRKAQVDLMHFPHFNVPLLYRGPFIVTIHDLIILRFPTERATTLGPLLYKIKHFAGTRVLNHAVRDSKKIITVSEFSKKDIVDYFHIDPTKVQVTYEAAEATAAISHRPNETVLEEYGIRQPYVLYVGNAYPHKNLEILLDVAAELKRTHTTPPWQFVLVGKSDYFYDRLQREVNHRKLNEYIHFTDFVPDADLPVLYQNALTYIFPSLYEGFGLPPLEAMSYGAPVMAASTSCLPEILGEAALYFDPNDISGIINLITTLKTDEATRHHLITQGKKQIQRYSWKSMASATLKMYEQYAKL